MEQNIKLAYAKIKSLKRNDGRGTTIDNVLNGKSAVDFISQFGLSLNNFDGKDTIEFNEHLREYHISGHYSTRDTSLNECKAKSIIQDLNSGFIFQNGELINFEQNL
jgi:hypothetical protein